MAYMICKYGLAGGGSITVSYESQYYDKTITCSNGITTLTDVTTSSGETTFNIDKEGIWTISCNNSTVTVNTIFSYSLSLKPDGKTVTPVNDIQTWLKCGGINDKDYTTLGEVIDDDETLLTLMNDNNAVDYLVRSTNWAASEAMIPTMTSNTTPAGYVASASTTYSTSMGTYPYKAFDKVLAKDSNSWAAADNDKVGAWLQIQLPVAKQANRMEVYRVDDYSRQTKSFTLLGSTNGTNWDELGVYETDFGSSSGSYYFNTIIEGGEYSYYRFVHISSAGTGSYDFAGFIEIQLYSLAINSSEKAMKFIGANDYAANTLLNNTIWKNAIQNSIYANKVYNVKVPTMTSNTTPYGECISNGAISDARANWYTFNDDWTYRNDIVNNDHLFMSTSTSANTGYIGYKFTAPTNITFCQILLANNTTTTHNETLMIQGSNDNNNWSNLLSENTIINVPDRKAFSTINNLTSISLNNDYSYQYYRIARAANGVDRFAVVEAQFLSHINAGVQTWLHTANITDKDYTTIEEVIADSTTLTTLLTSNDSIDYLAGCTNWAYEICSDRIAMELIGNNNYASNTLLADETWCNAICNSEYFESILNSKVPEMTSDTTPEGQVIYSSQYSAAYAAWKAFNSSGAWGTNTIMNQWCGYKFVEPICINKAYMVFTQGKNYRIEASNDGANYETIYTGVTPADSSTVSIYIPNNTEYLYYRLYVVDTWRNTAGYNISVNRIQFYGREDI